MQISTPPPSLIVTPGNGHTADHTLPSERWKFDAEVTDVFEDMLRRSIPQYEVMRQTVFAVGSHFVQQHTDIVDLGCSRGDSIAPFVDRFGAHNRFEGIEVSEPMLLASRERFAGLIKAGVVHLRNTDLRLEFPPVRASLILSVLTLQFIPIEYRQRIVSDVYKHLVPGGAFILVEKVLGTTADINGCMVGLYHGLKSHNGYSQEEIQRKALSLEGVLVPVTATWNEDLLRAAGFRQ
ncbi:MAG: methyltransferase domain-containing protein, partial [Chloroflexi bacterium]|nr:methyltransferase domain-containing protein [Chloroflexota bacterium]